MTSKQFDRYQGFDPETGEHDVQPDIDALRAAGLLTEEDEQALQAADETYRAAVAWGTAALTIPIDRKRH